jgi:DNA-binding LytR/AlgR family response regulator
LARDPDVVIVGRATQAISRAEIARHRPDVVFVEARMGVEAVEACLAPDPSSPRAAIIVSSVAADASGAFELDATDFLLRPFRPARIVAVLAKVRRYLAQCDVLREEQMRSARTLSSGSGRVLADAARHIEDAVCEIVTRDGTTYVQLSIIEAMIGAGAFTTILTRTASLTSIHSLSDLERRILPGVFLRTHRRAIVNIQNVSRLEAHGEEGGTLVMTSGARVPVARRRLALVRTALRTRASTGDESFAFPQLYRLPMRRD